MTLTERLQALTDPDREVDAEIWLRFTPGATREHTEVKSSAGQWPPYTIDETRDETGKLIIVPAYTASLDAAVALAESVLPGWTIARLGQDDNKRWNAELRQGYLTAYDRVTLGGSPNAAIALLIATLTAKEAKG